MGRSLAFTQGGMRAKAGLLLMSMFSTMVYAFLCRE
jgi:hypothetical protein